MRNELTVLCYHRVADRSGAGEFSNLVVNCSPESFEREVAFLKDHYNIISVEEAVAALRLKKDLPPDSLSITFDDGYRDNYTNAFPVLKKYRVSAAVFLTADFIGNDKGLIWTDLITHLIDSTKKGFIDIPRIGKYCLEGLKRREKAEISIIQHLNKLDSAERDKIIDLVSDELDVKFDPGIAGGVYLSGSEISEMSRSGMIFGSHGCSHSIFTRVKPARARREAVDSKARIEQITGKTTRFFAYPNGSRLDFNDETAGILKQAGYEAAFTTVHGVNRQSGDIDMFSLKRIPAGRSLEDLKKNLFMRRIKGRLF